MKNKEENHHSGFQQQSPQRLVDRCKHINRRRNGMTLKVKPLL